jgi:DNA polymerase I
MTMSSQFDLFASGAADAVDGSAVNPPSEENRPALFLLDGMALVYRSFFALQQARMSNREGVPTGAVFGFLSTLLKIVEVYHPEHIAVAFDSREKTFRHDRYAPYKANRPAPPEELVTQIELIHELIRAFGIPLVIMPGFEADDLIGSAARRFENECRIFIVTPDKDMAQLVHNGVRILKPGKKQNDFESMGIDEVTEQFGVPPRQFIDFLTLTGDTSDNIPGAKGIGPKTATTLLDKYGSLDELYRHLDDLSPEDEKQPRNVQGDDASRQGSGHNPDQSRNPVLP